MIAEDETRRTGIEAIGPVPWGTHLCQLHEGKQDLLDILVPYFRQGLADNEFCMWVASEPLTADEARAALAAAEPDLDKYLHEGRIEILDCSEWYTRTGRFDADSVLKGWVEKLERALARGYDGLRLTGSTFWLEDKDWADFTVYEEAVNRTIGNCRMLAICTYARQKCGAPEIMDVVSNHRFALVKRSGRWHAIESFERKQAEERARRHQVEIQTLLEEAQKIAHLGSFEYVAATRTTVWSEEEYRIYGLDPAGPSPAYDEMLAKCIHPDDAAMLHETFTKAMEDRSIYELEHRIVRPDGSVRWVYNRAHPYFDDAGNLVRYVGATLDITERKQLQRRVEYLAQFPQVNPNPVMRITADGAVKYANDAATPVLTAWDSGVEKKAPRAWRKRVKEAIDNGVPAVHEAVVGKEAYSFCIAPVAEQGYANLYGTLITDLKALHRQEKLATAAKTALDTVEAMREGIALVGMDGIVRSVNPALAKLVGYGSNQLKGRHIEELISRLLEPDSVAPARLALASAMRGETPALNEMTLIPADGRRIPILPTVAFIEDNAGNPATIVLTIQDISDIAKANAETREKAERLAEAQRIAHLGNWDWNIVKNTLSWSDEIYRIFGLNPGEFDATYEAFLNSVHPDDRQSVQQAVDGALYDDQVYSIDHRIVLPNGMERTVHEQGQVYRNGAGRPVRMIGTVQDITVRKRAEDRNRIVGTLSRLFAEKATRRQYVEAATDVLRHWSGCRCLGIRALNKNGEVPYESCLGFSPEFVESECRRLLVGRDQCVCTRIVAGRPDAQDATCMTSMGSFFCNDMKKYTDNLSENEKKRFRGVCVASGFSSVAVIPLRYQGRILGAIHAADERKGKVPLENVSFMESMAALVAEAVHRFGVEETLQASEERYRTLVENLPAITYTADIDETSTTTYVSPQIERILGFSPAQFKNDPDIWRKQLHDDDRDRVLGELARAHADGEAFALEYRMLAHDGRTVWLRDRGGVVLDANGAPSYVQGVMYDITEEKKAEEAFRSLASELALAEERERKRLAVALHDTISQTLALSKIKLGALKHMLETDEAKGTLREVRDLFSEAVDQTRTLSFELSPPILYELGLHAAVEWLGEDMQKRHGFNFALSSENDLDGLDEPLRVLMFQCMRELLTNAGKHAHAKNVRVTLQHSDGDLSAVVEDDGKGFDFDSARKRVGERHSIGLFSIEERMRHLGGAFRVESTPGRGTRVILSAPMKRIAECGARSAENRETNKEMSVE
ncbi:MAG: PAS domain-containing protein [Kiritimatiellae bacterium]|nr:PAS domain-containing protein [Kiritimatiellia bacterium]